MTIQELKLLNLLNRVTSHSEASFFYDSSDCSIRLVGTREHMVHCGKLSTEINGLFESLTDNKYIKPVPTYGLDSDHYCLTQKGIHRFQFSVGKIVKFIFTSILVPAAVAFVTALITTML